MREEYEMENDVVASLKKSSQYNWTPKNLAAALHKLTVTDFLPICVVINETKTLLTDIGNSKYNTGHFFVEVPNRKPVSRLYHLLNNNVCICDVFSG